MSYSRLIVIATENILRLLISWNLRYKTSIPKKPNQSSQLTVILKCLIVRYVSVLYHFYDITNPWLQNVQDEIEIVSMSIRDIAHLRLLCYKK